jgi:hypothetical protein
LFTEYNGLVSFYCGIGAERFIATQTSSNFNCQIKSAPKDGGFVLVSLYAKYSNEELKVSTNDVSIYIYSNLFKY